MTRRKRGPGLEALRHRDFALYAGASFLSTIALQIQATALAWQIYEITRDPLQLGLVGLAEFLPGMLLAVPAGHLADRVDRRLLMAIGVSAELVAAVVLFSLAATGQITELAILALALAFGIARAVATPAARAMMPNLMPKEHFASAVAWSSTSWQVATIAGPGLGGLLYSVMPAVAYAGATIGFAGAVVLVLLIRSQAVPVTTRSQESDLSAVLAGLTLIFRKPVLLGTVSLDLFAVLFSGATALIPVFAQDILHVGADAGGLLRSAQGMGATVTALARPSFPCSAIWDAACSSRSASSALPRSPLACHATTGCPSGHCWCWARRTWSASTSGEPWYRWRRLTSCGAASLRSRPSSSVPLMSLACSLRERAGRCWDRLPQSWWVAV